MKTNGLVIPRDPEVGELNTYEMDRMEEVCFAPYNVQKAEVGFIFGSTRKNWGEAAVFYYEDVVPRFIVNGWCPTSADPALCIPHAHAARDSLIAHGVPLEAILVQDESRHTLEDALFGRLVLQDHGRLPESILMIASAIHSGRALLTLRAVFKGVQIFTAPLPSQINGMEITVANWRTTETGRRRVYGEYLRILRYAAHGDIAMPPRADKKLLLIA